MEMFRGIGREFPVLAGGTRGVALLLAVSLALMAVDSRLVVGVNPWLKPVKFGISIVAFNLTIGWMLMALALPVAHAARAISWVVALAMLVEIGAIVLQAARGVPSHYNVTTPFNTAVFTAMAAAIVLNTIAVGALCALAFRPQPQLAKAVAWGVRLGLVLFLFGSIQGFQMVANKGHTVGAQDGGPGLPLVRWSTRAGDLRVAHFAGIHAIQVLPLLGYILSRTDRKAGVPAVAVAFLALAALFIWAHCDASAGRPLLRGSDAAAQPLR